MTTITTTTTTSVRPLPSPAALGGTLLAALAVGIGLGIVAHGDTVLAVDLDLTIWLQQLQGGAIRAVADIANVIGSTGGASVIIAVAIIVAALRRASWELVFLVALILLRLAGTRLKPLFDSARPTEELVTLTGSWESTGYPSGHALTASTMALGLGLIAWRRIPSRRRAIGVIGILLALAVLIGWARVWSGAHWASDVVGGYAFGIAIVAASVLVAGRLTRRQPAVRSQR